MVKPANLIFFQSDNHNGHLVGCYGHPYVKTPNMDRIAGRGVRFTNAYCTSPLCCPSRSSLATGRYPHQTGYWDNALTYDGRLPTWHHRLREQGHNVTAIGKLHFRIGERPEHPAADYLRHMDGMRVMTDEGALKRIAAGYFGLITHLDEQIGIVLKTAEDLGLFENTRVAYTSDHGELFGAQGIFGKKNLYEGAIRVPLLIAGPGVPQDRMVRQLTSHVDMFPTLIAGAGAQLANADSTLPGMNLWPAISGIETDRILFAEYHAQGSKAGAFVVREGNLKLIYHVGMPAQLFDLGLDPDETHDLIAAGSGLDAARRLEAHLRVICDPEAVDGRAKADQRAAADFWGGTEKLKNEPQILFTPPPGVTKEEAWAIPAR